MTAKQKRVLWLLLGGVFLSLAVWWITALPGPGPTWVLIDIYDTNRKDALPRYSLFLRGAKSWDVHFEGAVLEHRYIGLPGRYVVHGSGDILWHSNIIHIEKGTRVQINKKELPSYPAFVIHDDGSFDKGYLGQPV